MRILILLAIALPVILVSGCGTSSGRHSGPLAVGFDAAEPFALFLRAFKHEGELEAWVKPDTANRYHLLKTYPICRKSGDLGPKRREGDLQVPEGVYHVDRFNPNSSYHLSLGLNYPNASDRVRGDAVAPGSDIFIHGECVTVGCLPMTNPLIEEIYALAEAAKGHGQRIAVHIFPCRMDRPYAKDLLASEPAHVAFWQELKPVYAYFEANKTVPSVTIGPDGGYAVR